MKEGTMKRLLKMLWSKYKIHLIVVFLCIVGNALFNVQGTMFMQTLIDDYIVPLLKSSSPDFSGLFHALIRVGALYACGVVCAFTFNRIMVYVTQGFLRDLRIGMFEHMESLPIRYFDRTPHGDTMSVYTNDIDTLRQLISQSIPQLISSCMTIVTTFVSMIILNIPLTVLSVCMLMIMLVVSRKLGSLSGKFFVQQQGDLGKVNGYIEEMISGQKVVKVFNHEDQAIADFRKLNDELRESAYQAHKFANILMPVTVQLGNISYIICAIVGAILALNGHFALTIGTLVAFLTLNKSFNQPIGQISQQINAVAMAQAGAGRIFDLLDQESEDDQGVVTLCRVETVDGKMVETDKRTGHWAWKHPRSDGHVELVEMKGDIRLEGVNFGYFDDRMVLHNVDVYANPGEKIAFVGATGAGKTTITNLINRFYDIQKGSITYDGIDIKLIKKDDLRRSLGVVLQDTHLFTGTVMDNIRYGRLDATDEECIAAAKLAGCFSGKILMKHIFPNIAGTIIVTAVLDIGTMIMELAGLSFLGLGATPPVAEWGSMMSNGRSMLQTCPWIVLAPGAAIFITVALFNLLGDTVRDMV